MTEPTSRRRGISRRRVLSLHSWLGLIAGVFFVLFSFTGAINVFADELNWLTTPAARTSFSQPRLSMQELVARVGQQHGLHVSSVQPGKYAGWADTITARAEDGADTTFYVNSATGALQGERKRQEWIQFAKSLHTNLLLDKLGRPYNTYSRIGVCAFGLVLFTSGLTGLLLQRHHWRSMLAVFSRHAGGSFSYRLHNAIGVWSILFNVIIASTTIYWGISEVMRIGKLEGGRREERRGPAGGEQRGGASTPLPDVSVALNAVQQQHSALKITSIRSMRGDTPRLEITGMPAGLFIERRAIRLVVDAGTGAEVTDAAPQRGPAENQNKLTSISKLLHFGRWGEGAGPWADYAVKFLWLFFGLAPGALSITGAILFFRRSRRMRHLRQLPQS